MPRRTHRQLAGKQEDIDREEREAELRTMAWELHLAWALGDKKSDDEEVELDDQAELLTQAITMLLTCPAGTM
jgi:hypothetical protein